MRETIINVMKLLRIIFLLVLLIKTEETLGQFGQRQIIDSSAAGITEIITADINNDNWIDIIISQSSNQTNKISYYLNLGNGSFGLQNIVGAQQFPRSVAAGDFNNDGWVDIVTVSGTDSTVIIFYNLNGNFSSSQIIDSVPFGVKVIVEDVDKDNNKDIIVIADVLIYVYHNDGFGNFIKSDITATYNAPVEFYGGTVGDINGDGFPDLITGGTTKLIFINNNGTFQFDSLRTTTIQSFGLVFTFELNDLDGDGDNDLVFDNNTGPVLEWYSNDGNGFFSLEQTIDTETPASVELQDIDNDGDIDVFAAFSQQGEIVWYSNDGNGNFSSKKIIYQGAVPFTKRVHSDDLNNDGLRDLIWAEELSVHLYNTTVKVVNIPEVSLDIFPNPATRQIHIKSNYPGKLSVYDNTGKRIYTDLAIKKGENTFRLSLTPQVYILRIEMDKPYKNVYRKILVK